MLVARREAIGRRRGMRRGKFMIFIRLLHNHFARCGIIRAYYRTNTDRKEARMASITKYAKRWKMKWEGVLETANRIGIALFVAGLLRGIAENNAGYRIFLWSGIALIVVSLMRRKDAAEMPEKTEEMSKKT